MVKVYEKLNKRKKGVMDKDTILSVKFQWIFSTSVQEKTKFVKR
jgi:hypothetical protein